MCYSDVEGAEVGDTREISGQSGEVPRGGAICAEPEGCGEGAVQVKGRVSVLGKGSCVCKGPGAGMGLRVHGTER